MALALDAPFAYAEPVGRSISSHEKSLSIPAVVAKVRPSVVTILTRGMPATPTQAQSGSGSGVIIDESGYILTNNHLVAGIKSLVVGLSTGRLTPGRVVARDFLLDLALVKITATDLVPATLSPVPVLEIGESVVAIGNPLALKGGSTVTAGVVSAVDRSVLTPDGETLYDLIQTDAAINPGNSGGALVDVNGNLQGINTAIYSRSGGSLGIGFAIPVSTAKQVMEGIVKDGVVTRGWIGVEPQDLSPELAVTFGIKNSTKNGEAMQGVIITGVLQGAPAAKAGIVPGDIIVSIAGKPIRNVSELLTQVAMIKPGKSELFGIIRKEAPLELNVAAGTRPRPKAQAR